MEDELEDSAHPLDKLLKRSKKERSASPAITVSGSAEVNGRPTPGTKPKPSKKRKKLKTPADGSIIKRKDATSKSKGSRLRAIEPLSGVTVPAEDGAEQSAADSAVKENADLGAAEKKKLAAKRLPLGAVLVPSDVDRNLEVTRLLKPTRYFDEDFEANAMKCYHCGGTGHLARTCRNEPRQRPCHICAQSHDRAMRCPNTVCYRCSQVGHMARECPNPEGSGGLKICLRCGRADCAAAGDDVARSDGGCSNQYSLSDLKAAICYVCHSWGHLCCGKDEAPAPTTSCANCGEEGHTHRSCPQPKQPHILTEDHQRGLKRRVQALLGHDPYSNYGSAASVAPVPDQQYRAGQYGRYVTMVSPTGLEGGGNFFRQTASPPYQAQQYGTVGYGGPSPYASRAYGQNGYGRVPPAAVPPSYSPQLPAMPGTNPGLQGGQYGVPGRWDVGAGTWQYGVPQRYPSVPGNVRAFLPQGGNSERWQLDDGGYDSMEVNRPYKRRR